MRIRSAISTDWREPFLATLRERNPAKIGINFDETDYGIDGLTHGLYLLLAAEDQDSAHSRYNALIRRLVSFESSVECAR